jgi:tRNA pseudouridine55 synthase
VNVAAGDFVLPVDKPVGPTSHDVVAAARRALGTRRVGHTGTLDPFASGLLVLCIGRATRLAEYLSGMSKTYHATARLGVTTDTLDRDGSLMVERDASSVDEAAIRQALAGLVGDIQQVPPQFSAKKVDGEAMHRRARRGEHVELPPVDVTIHEAELVSCDSSDLEFSVRCSSGTYIRAIARDVGEALGVGAHLTELRRTSVGQYRIEDAVSMDELADEAVVARARVTPIAAMAHLEGIALGDEHAARLLQGQRIRIAGEGEGRSADRVAISFGEDLLAIAELDDGVIRPRKVFPA